MTEWYERPLRPTSFWAALAVLLVLMLMGGSVQAQSSDARLLLRVDDIGMNHAVNQAAEDLVETGLPFSASVMFACPWHQEAIDVLEGQPQVSVGVHLTLNSEWKHYRWGPILGTEAVPSLVDSTGHFHRSTETFLDHEPDLEDVERELRAQIERAIQSELEIDYVDYHMGTAVATPELRSIVERLAEEYDLGMAEYFNEEYHTLWNAPITEKTKTFTTLLDDLPAAPTTTLAVFHIAEPTPEMRSLVDLNASLMNTPNGDPRTFMHRKAELDVLLSDEIADRLSELALVTYGDLVQNQGLAAMERPEAEPETSPDEETQEEASQ